MLKRKLKTERGFTLVEVVVSMLVLSIVIVSVLSAFVNSSKANNKTKVIQGAETLLSNLTEFIEAGGAETSTALDVDFSVMSMDTRTENDVNTNSKKYTYSNVEQGFNKYKVEIVKDIEPSKYSNLNGYDVIRLGDSSSCSMLFDVSTQVSAWDEDAIDSFRKLHQDQIRKLNEEAGTEKYTVPELSGTSFKFFDVTNEKQFDKEDYQMISREVHLKVKNVGADEMEVEIFCRYILDSSVVLYDLSNDGSMTDEQNRDYEVNVSQKFKRADVTGTHLDNIYLLYSPSKVSGAESDDDILVYGDTSSLDANLFIVYQNTGTQETVDNAANKSLSERFNGKSVTVRCKDKPKGLQVYCSATVDKDLSLSETGNYTDVTFHSNNLIATDNKRRVYLYQVSVYDMKTGDLLGKSEATCLVKNGR